MDEQATDWENMFVRHVSDQTLAPKIYKEYQQLHNLLKNPILKIG